jgi:hypothetical protein
MTPDNMNGSQRFLEKSNVEWPSLKAAGADITAESVPSKEEVQTAFNEYMHIYQRFSIPRHI